MTKTSSPRGGRSWPIRFFFSCKEKKKETKRKQSETLQLALARFLRFSGDFFPSSSSLSARTSSSSLCVFFSSLHAPCRWTDRHHARVVCVSSSSSPPCRASAALRVFALSSQPPKGSERQDFLSFLLFLVGPQPQEEEKKLALSSRPCGSSFQLPAAFVLGPRR